MDQLKQEFHEYKASVIEKLNGLFFFFLFSFYTEKKKLIYTFPYIGVS